MKTKFMQILAALILPISFIIILIILNAVPITSISKYGLGGLLMTVIALLLTYITVIRDKTTFKKIGFQLDRKTPSRFIIGFLIGFVITALMLALSISFSSLEISYNSKSSIQTVLLWLLAFFPLAYMEEIIFRGYAFTKINNKFGIWPAQILLALLFTWYHDFTGASFLNQLLGPGIWAFIYGIAAIWSKGIALPTGLHMAINVILALVGQKDERHAIWNLEFPTDITPSLRTQTENIGLFMQLFVLIIAIILTEYYRRNKLKIDKELN
ncbi:CPBP family intramembrane glutamic endopeptidase [Ichthyenterobacterium magnum]|uniref:CAAX prenyl protease 2/Lysostaphin resistance protein A-like domain-containing protein n=1 Tax=Ichthyenterobacterium magnum TaxID=1230530 RepID=A0A420DF42_9FLAO|nr:CPBP family intramembrane glutamic endopeptidase [Ichthyenterobacterium magnum]RKE90883.1 hypothetical protein BXY80_2473 [Ichthyenterobacterium magnum]